MPPLRLLAALLVLALLAPAASAQEALPLGAQIPLDDRVMQNAAGEPTSLRQQVGPSGLAVVFWSTTCPWVRRNEARLLQLAAEFMPAGVGFVAINPNDPASSPEEGLPAMRAHMGQLRYPFPYVVDAGSEAARAFGATRTPQVFLFDRQGRLVYEGAIDDSPADAARVQAAYFRDALAAVVAGEPVRLARTRAFGCTIKFAP